MINDQQDQSPKHRIGDNWPREVLAESRTPRTPPPNCKHRPMVANVYLAH